MRLINVFRWKTITKTQPFVFLYLETPLNSDSGNLLSSDSLVNPDFSVIKCHDTLVWSLMLTITKLTHVKSSQQKRSTRLDVH